MWRNGRRGKTEGNIRLFTCIYLRAYVSLQGRSSRFCLVDQSRWPEHKSTWFDAEMWVKQVIQQVTKPQGFVLLPDKMLSKGKKKIWVSAIIPKTSYWFTVIVPFFVTICKTWLFFRTIPSPFIHSLCRSSNPEVMTGVSYVGECRRLIEPRSWFRTRGDIWVLALLAPATPSMLQIQRSSCRLNTSINLYLPGRGKEDGYRESEIFQGPPVWLFPGRDLLLSRHQRRRTFTTSQEQESDLFPPLEKQLHRSFSLIWNSIYGVLLFLIDKYDLKARRWLMWGVMNS